MSGPFPLELSGGDYVREEKLVRGLLVSWVGFS